MLEPSRLTLEELTARDRNEPRRERRQRGGDSGRRSASRIIKSTATRSRNCKGLATTAGSRIVGQLTQRRQTPDVTTYLGKGKVEELKQTGRRRGRRRDHLRQRSVARPRRAIWKRPPASRCSIAPS